MSTGPLTVRLVAAQPPRISVSGSPSIHVDLYPPAGATEPLLYTDWSMRPGAQYYWGRGWTMAPSDRLIPGCREATRWHLIAGWLNQPVATVDYMKR